MSSQFLKTKKSCLLAERGFSLVEVLISMMVFSLGLVSIANLMLGSLKSSVDSRNNIIASQLAQEGTELIRNFRDNNIAFGFLAFANMPTNSSALCPRVDLGVKDAGFVTCPVVAGFPQGQLFYDAVSGFNRYDRPLGNEPATIFLRKVTIDSNNPHLVQSMVIWGGTTFPTAANCTLASKCTYMDLTLNDEGWK